jgi:hypothetical protein
MTTKARGNASKKILRRASHGECCDARTAHAVAGIFVLGSPFGDASPLKASGPASPLRDPSPNERDVSQRGLVMSKKRIPSHHPSNDPQHRRGDRIKSADPPHDIKGPSHQTDYPNREPIPSFTRRLARIGRDIYMLGQYPWVFVILILSYFGLSVTWLIEKASTFSVLSVALSAVVLIYAVVHNLVELMECLSVVLRHIGFAFRFMGRAFTEAGQLFRRTAKRLRETLGDVRHVQ